MLPVVKLLPFAPAQVPPAAPVAKICRLLSVSVKAAAVSAVLFELVSVRVSVELLVALAVLARMTPALKPTEIWAGEATVRLAVFEPLPATGVCAEVTPLAEIGPWRFEVGALTRQLATDYRNLVRQG